MRTLDRYLLLAFAALLAAAAAACEPAKTPKVTSPVIGAAQTARA